MEEGIRLASWRRALTDKVFWLIVSASALGYFQHSPWSIPLLAVLLTLWSAVSDPHWYEQFRKIRALPAYTLFWLGSLAQNILFVGAAFVAGHGTRWLWETP